MEKQRRSLRENFLSVGRFLSGKGKILLSGVFHYLRSLKYFFTPIGTLAIAMVLGFSQLISGATAAISELSRRLTEISEAASIDLLPIRSRLTDVIGTLNWNQPTDALRTAFTTEWLKEAWEESIATCEGLTDTVRAEIGEAVSTCAAHLTDRMYLFVLLVWIGLAVGYLITRWQIRRILARRAFWKMLMIVAVNALINATVVAFCTWMLTRSGASAAISLLASLILWEFISLFEAYLVHGWKKVKFWKAVNLKAVGWLLLANLLIFLIALGIAWLISLMTNEMVGIFVGIATVEIAYIVSNLNAEAYVKELAEELPPAEPIEENLPS